MLVPTAIPEGHEPLFQIFVSERQRDGRLVRKAVGPRMCRRFLEPLMETIGKRIAGGIERKSSKPWSYPELVQVTIPEPNDPFTREDRQNDRVNGYRHVPD
jgi:hypothetical protein